MLKFSKANAKTQALANDSELADYLTDKRKIYSLDLLSGYSCPHAKQCLSKACLLYTSPSPRDVEESRMPSSA